MNIQELEELNHVHDLRAYCPYHPNVCISNGMFDAPCGECEAEMERIDKEEAILRNDD